MKTCRKKWDIDQQQKPKHERRPCPEPPKEFTAALNGSSTGGYDLEAYNAQAFDSYNTKALVPCDGCGRTFLPDSLIKHQKACKGGGGGAKAATLKPGASAAMTGGGGGGAGGGGGGALSKSMKPPAPVRPKTLVCYICGREFGSASLEIHLKSCKKKWENEQM